MRQAYSKDIEDRVIELHVIGYNFQEISTQVGVSVGYVSSVKEKYEDKLGKGELEATHEFFKIVRKLGIAPQQLLIGTRTFSLLRENKLKSEELELFLKKVSKIMQEKDFELSTIIDVYEKVLILQSRSKVSLEHLPTEYEAVSNKVIKLQKEISELKITLDGLDQGLNNHISMYHSQGIYDLLEAITDKGRYLKNYGDSLKRHHKGKIKNIKEIESIQNEIKNITAEINLDKKKRLKFPSTQPFNPPLYLKYYLTSMAPYVLDKIDEMNQQEKRLDKFNPL